MSPIQSYLGQSMLYLGAMVLSVPLVKRWGLGAVIGYLFAGAALGPSALGLLGADQESVLHFAELGIIMMLFLIGLELRPSRLWKMRTPVFGLGSLQFFVTVSIFAGGYYYFVEDFKQSLVLGMIVAMSSTALVVQSFQERKILKTTGGETAFSILLFQDVALIPILAFIPFLRSSPVDLPAELAQVAAGQDPAWMPGVKILVAVVVVIFVGRFASRQIFRAVANSKTRELFTAAALLLVLGTTALMNAVGLSPALGAFLAGVVLADSEYRHQLEVDLEPFKGLLLGVFFISVGVGIDFPQMAEKPLITAGLVFSILLLKMAVLWGVGRAGSLRTPDRFILALGLSQVGEFAFVLIKFSSEQAILESSVARLFNSVVALTMVATPIVLAIYFRYFEPGLAQQKEKPPSEEVEEKENPVIVAGYGRFGQTATRLLRSAGFGCTVLDYDADHVEMLRGFGMKSYFGDPSRIDLLRSIGADQAKLLIIATDNFEQMPTWVEEVKKEFPHLKILARSFDRIHAYEMLHRGVDHIYIETSGSAVNLGIDALCELGMQAKHASHLGHLFQKHNNQSIRDLAKTYKESDESTYLSQARLSREQLEKVLKLDAIDLIGPHDISDSDPR